MVKLARTILVCTCILLLTGCPLTVAITLHNATKGPVVIQSEKNKVVLGPSRSVTTTLDEFQFDRNFEGADLLEISGSFGTRCYEIVFAGIGLKGDELDRSQNSTADVVANLVIGNDGNVYVISKTKVASAMAEEYRTLQGAPRLVVCRNDH